MIAVAGLLVLASGAQADPLQQCARELEATP